MTSTIYVILHARDSYDGFSILSSAGYFTDEQEAIAYAESLPAKDFEEWQKAEWKQYHYDNENYLYPELIEHRKEHELLMKLFGGRSIPQVPDVSKEHYDTYAEYPIYRVVEIEPHRS